MMLALILSERINKTVKIVEIEKDSFSCEIDLNEMLFLTCPPNLSIVPRMFIDDVTYKNISDQWGDNIRTIDGLLRNVKNEKKDGFAISIAFIEKYRPANGERQCQVWGWGGGRAANIRWLLQDLSKSAASQVIYKLVTL